MTSTLDLAVRLSDQASGNFKKINEAVDSMNSRLDAAKDRIDRFSGSLAATGTKMSAFVTAPILGMGGAMLKAAADQEQLDIAFKTMLGSAEKAQVLMQQLKDFSASTPFEMPEVVNAGRQLLAYGIEAENVQGTLRMLGDVASGTGSSIGDLAYLFGTAKAQGRLFGADINQFAGRGIPIIEYLAKTMGVAQEEVKALVSEGKVGFPEMQAAFAAMTAEGSKFGGLMEAQSHSLGGLFSTLKDNLTITLTDIGLKLVDAFDLRNKAADALVYVDEFRTKLLSFIDANPELVRTGAIFLGIAAAIGPALIALSGVVKAVGFIVPAIQFLGAAFAALTSPLGLAVAGLGLLIAYDVGGFRTKIVELGSAFVNAAGIIAENAASLVDDIKTAFDWIINGNGSEVDWWWDITDILNQIGLVSDETAIKMGDFLYDMGVKASDAVVKVKEIFTAFSGTVNVETLNESFTTIGTSVEGLVAKVTESKDTVIGFFGSILEKISSLSLVENTITNIQNAITALVDGFQTAFTSEAFKGEALASLQKTFDSLKETMTNLQPIITVIAGLIGGTLLIAINLFVGALQGLPDIASAAIDQLLATFQLIATTLEGVTGIVAALIAGDWTGAWDSAKIVFSGFYDYMKSTADNLKLLFAGIIEVVTGAFTTTLAAFGVDVTGITSSVDTMIGFIKGFTWPTFPEAAKALTEWVFPEVSETVTKFLAWAFPDVPDAIKTLVTWAFPSIPPVITSLVTWAFPTVPHILTLLTTWVFPTIPTIIQTLVDWDFPDVPKIISDLLDWEWPTFTRPAWLDNLPGFLGGGDGNAMGTTYYPGGATSISERGGEVAILPGGTKILNNRESQALGSGGGAGIGSMTVNIYGNVDSSSRVTEFVDLIVNELNRRNNI